VFPGPCRLDGSVQRQQVRLGGNLFYRARDFCDLTGLVLEFAERCQVDGGVSFEPFDRLFQMMALFHPAPGTFIQVPGHVPERSGIPFDRQLPLRDVRGDFDDPDDFVPFEDGHIRRLEPNRFTASVDPLDFVGSAETAGDIPIIPTFIC